MESFGGRESTPQTFRKIQNPKSKIQNLNNLMSHPTNNIPIVDLVIVIDTSPSMKDEARGLSSSASDAINCASTNCPSDLRVTWFGIEGTWRGTNFNQTIRNYLTKNCEISDSQLRGRKRGQLKSAGAQEDVARAIEDICDYFDWRENAVRAIFCLGDEALEGGG
ncbi:MAG: VWA domain-containing protein, partial [Cyanobacteria bacterium P01_D01_bin.116]